MTDLSTHYPQSYWWGPDQCRLGWCLCNSCTHFRHYQPLANLPWCSKNVIRLLIAFSLSWFTASAQIANQHNGHKCIFFPCRDLLWRLFMFGETFKKTKTQKSSTEDLLKRPQGNALWCSLPLAAVLEIVSVSPGLWAVSHRRMARLMIKARRERTKAAIPKFSPTVVSRGNRVAKESLRLLNSWKDNNGILSLCMRNTFC